MIPKLRIVVIGESVFSYNPYLNDDVIGLQ